MRVRKRVRRTRVPRTRVNFRRRRALFNVNTSRHVTSRLTTRGCAHFGLSAGHDTAVHRLVEGSIHFWFGMQAVGVALRENS